MHKSAKSNFKKKHCRLTSVSSLIIAIQRDVVPESNSMILLRELEQGVAAGERYMLDEKELKENYASDQGKLNAIFKNAIRVSCPIRNITLWLDQGLAYTEGHMAQNEEKEETTTVNVHRKTKENNRNQSRLTVKGQR